MTMSSSERGNHLLKSDVFPAMAADPLELGVTEYRDTGVMCARMMRDVVVVTVVCSPSTCDVCDVCDVFVVNR